jgi:hypothetical protein
MKNPMGIASPMGLDSKGNRSQKEGFSLTERANASPVFYPFLSPAQSGLTASLPHHSGKELLLLESLLPRPVSTHGILTLAGRERQKPLRFDRPEFLHEQTDSPLNKRDLFK